MEFLPFAFCEDVCHTQDLFELSNLETIRAQFWNKAAAEISDRRVRVGITVSYGSGAWSHRFKELDERGKRKRGIIFKELQRHDQNHLQVKQVDFGLSAATHQKATLNELLSILKSTIPLHNYPMLTICENHFPSDELTRILSLYRSVPFWSMYCNTWSRPVDEFLKIKLKSANGLACLSLESQSWSEGVRLTIEEYATSNAFISIKLYNDAYSKSFFERLFETSLKTSKADFRGQFSFKFKELYGFKPEIQDAKAASRLPSSRFIAPRLKLQFQNIVWRRRDGVQVTATCLLDYNWDIKWAKI